MLLKLIGTGLGAVAKGLEEVGSFVINEIKESPTEFSDALKKGYEDGITMDTFKSDEDEKKSKDTKQGAGVAC